MRKIYRNSFDVSHQSLKLFKRCYLPHKSCNLKSIDFFTNLTHVMLLSCLFDREFFNSNTIEMEPFFAMITCKIWIHCWLHAHAIDFFFSRRLWFFFQNSSLLWFSLNVDDWRRGIFSSLIPSTVNNKLRHLLNDFQSNKFPLVN